MDKDYFIKKWLNDSLTEAEMENFRNLDDFHEMNAIIENAKFFQASSVENPGDFESLRKYIDQSAVTERSSRNKWQPWLRMTGVFIIGIAVYFFLFQDKATTIETVAGEKTEVLLPDASEVTLNALSKLEYRDKDWEGDRAINLEGEAFFKVSKGGQFQVITSAGTVSVLGTQFNVKQRGDYFEVYCYEGRVLVATDSIEEKLLAGDKIQVLEGVFSRGKHLIDAPQWLKNSSRFVNVPIREVFDEMERQYGISIRSENISNNLRFTGGFIHDNLKNALIEVTVPLNLHFTIVEPNLVTISPGE